MALLCSEHWQALGIKHEWRNQLGECNWAKTFENILKINERETTEGLIRVFLQVRVGAASLSTPPTPTEFSRQDLRRIKRLIRGLGLACRKGLTPGPTVPLNPRIRGISGRVCSSLPPSPPQEGSCKTFKGILPIQETPPRRQPLARARVPKEGLKRQSQKARPL